jgi:hypothetical protein
MSIKNRKAVSFIMAQLMNDQYEFLSAKYTDYGGYNDHNECNAQRDYPQVKHLP